MYGPCDPKWRSWWDVPAWALDCYSAMLPRLHAEKVRELANALLATNQRAFDDDARRQFWRELTDVQEAQRGRAPKATPGFLRRAGIRMKGGER